MLWQTENCCPCRKSNLGPPVRGLVTSCRLLTELLRFLLYHLFVSEIRTTLVLMRINAVCSWLRSGISRWRDRSLSPAGHISHNDQSQNLTHSLQTCQNGTHSSLRIIKSKQYYSNGRKRQDLRFSPRANVVRSSFLFQVVTNVLRCVPSKRRKPSTTLKTLQGVANLKSIIR
jgi:hypothetical protein